MSDQTPAKGDEFEYERDGYEYADDVINELLREIEKVQSWHMVTRCTAVRIVALLFSTDEDKLLRLTGELER